VSAAVVEASRALRDALAAVDVDQLSGTESAAVVAALAITEKVCEAARVRAAARAVACGAHRPLGFAEPAEWLSRQSGSSLPAAKAALETVSALEALPATREAVETGRVSLAQAGEITRAEADAPGCEASLLAHAADHGLRSLQDRARAVRLSAADPEELHLRRHAARSVRHWADEQGMVHLHAALPPEVGRPIVHRLEAETDRIRRDERRAGVASRGRRTPPTPWSGCSGTAERDDPTVPTWCWWWTCVRGVVDTPTPVSCATSSAADRCPFP
jgi:hypothetical protein